MGNKFSIVSLLVAWTTEYNPTVQRGGATLATAARMHAECVRNSLYCVAKTDFFIDDEFG
jgi:hypothetical protein